MIGLDARDTEQIWTSLQHHLHRTGSGGINTFALSAINIAVWDLVAKSQGVPLSQALGGARKSIPAYGSGIDLFMSPDQLREHLQAYLDQGYDAVKIKVGRETLREDLERVAVARETIGPDRKLLVDANQCWRLEEAIPRVKAFEVYQPYWIEEPLVSDDVGGHARLRQVTSIPIAAGESLYSKYQFLEYLRADAIDILQPDVCRVGGITECMKIAALAQSWNLPFAPHFMMELSVHLLCAVSNGLILENVTGGSLTDMGLLSEPITVENGIGTPGSAAGHGIQFDQEQLGSRIVDSEDLRQLDTTSYKEGE